MTANYPRRTPLQLALARLGACREARVWAGHRDVYAMWNECHNGAWMLWLASQLQMNRPAVAAILDWLQVQLCCIRDDIPGTIAALPGLERGVLLALVAYEARRQISSGEIARAMELP
jgi:hypothetical protein